MTRGTVTKVVRPYGAPWGRIRPHEQSREVFFNTPSMAQNVNIASMAVGLEVEFDERADHFCGSHAAHLVVAKPETESKVARP